MTRKQKRLLIDLAKEAAGVVMLAALTFATLVLTGSWLIWQ